MRIPLCTTACILLVLSSVGAASALEQTVGTFTVDVLQVSGSSTASSSTTDSKTGVTAGTFFVGVDQVQDSSSCSGDATGDTEYLATVGTTFALAATSNEQDNGGCSSATQSLNGETVRVCNPPACVNGRVNDVSPGTSGIDPGTGNDNARVTAAGLPAGVVDGAAFTVNKATLTFALTQSAAAPPQTSIVTVGFFPAGAGCAPSLAGGELFFAEARTGPLFGTNGACI